MKIDRPELISKLLEFARAGNGIIVGRPGVGKSYSILELRDKLKKLRIPHLILPVERLGEGTDQDIQLLLKRKGDFVELLEAVPSEFGGVNPLLIFDGFDAARGERQREGILKLITRAVNQLSDKWRIIVSVRIFDASKSERLLALFPPSQSDETRDNIRCRHICIPPLDQTELEQAFNQNSRLRQVYANGSVELRELLTIPFHLWLVEKALVSGTEVAAFSNVTSEVQLLDLYWRRRVISQQDAEDRRFLLTKATDLMVRTHTLSVPRQSIYQPAAATAWAGLLSDEVLSEQPDSELVTFSHNILFDFAVTALLLQSEPRTLADFIAEEPARPLFLRPSLVYHFTRLWHFDRDRFWRNYWYATSATALHLRQIIRIVLPAVLIAEVRVDSDLSPLRLKLSQQDPAAVDAVSFTLQALRVLGPAKPELWAHFINDLGPHLDRRFGWDAGVIVLSWLENDSELSNDDRIACGEFGRKFLSWAWSMRDDPACPWFERAAGLLGVPIVARTFATSPDESYQLLRQVLDVVDQAGFPIDCIWRLTHEVQKLIHSSPSFVAEIYERIFGHEETSIEKTQMGTPVLGLISNRRQDYDGCEYNLLQSFSTFLSSAPKFALVAGIRSLEAYAYRDHVRPYLKQGRNIQDIQQQLTFRGRDARYTPDMSAIWDESKYPDRELKLADEMFKWLRTLAASNDIPQIDEFLETFAATASYAFLWKRLLECGVEAPQSIGIRLWELATANAFLHGGDVRHALGKYLKHVSQYLSEEVRRKLEISILEIPNSGKPDEDRAFLERCRNRLLGCIPRELLVSSEVIALRTKLDSEGSIPSNEPPFQMRSWSGDYTEEDFLREKGAEPDKPENKSLRDLYLPLKNWNEKGREAQRIDELMSCARRLKERLLSDQSADPAVILAAWTQFGEFVAHAALESRGEDSRLAELKQMVLLISAHEEPTAEPNEDSTWKSAVWSPAPRNSAAQALPWICVFQPDQDVIDAIEKLARDPVPSVRFLLVNELWRLGKHAPEKMWNILEDRVATETNQIVLGGITRSLSHAWRFDENRALPLVLSILQKPHDESESTFGFWYDTVRIIADLAVWKELKPVTDMIEAWIASPTVHQAALATSGQRLIGYIRPQQNRASFTKARELVVKYLDSAAKGLTEIQRNATEQGITPPANSWKQLYNIIDEAVMRIYFAADIAPNLRQHSEHPLDDVTRPRFFRDALPVLEKVLSFGKTPEAGVLLAPTAHHFMELLNGVLRYDPPLVLRMAADVIASSKRYQYNLDGLAMKEVVKLVESLLADYREYIQDDASVTNLLNVLDAFVDAGWPEALKLVWRLDEVYR